MLISLNGINDDYSSIKWTNQIPEDNLDIISNADLNVTKVDNLIFDELRNKWIFDMYVSDLTDTDLFVNSKIKIDLKYNNEEILGTCIPITNNKISCSTDYENQKNDDKMVISTQKKRWKCEFHKSENKPEI